MTGYLISIGFVFLIVGVTYLITSVNALDQSIQSKIFQFFDHPRWESIFRNFWPFGRTYFTLLILILVLLLNLKIGLIASTTFAVTAALERIIKLVLKRERPFIQDAAINMKQPKMPTDPSFPSGDTLRLWFLAVGIALTLQSHWIVILVACLLAIIISLGRIALGVHYPLDVLGGFGLGLMSSGVLIYLVNTVTLPYL